MSRRNQDDWEEKTLTPEEMDIVHGITPSEPYEDELLKLWESMFGDSQTARANQYVVSYKTFMALIKSHTEKALKERGFVSHGGHKMYTEAEVEQRIVEAEFMVASSLMITMSPLMVHRLEKNFPEMTGEVIGNLYEEIKTVMKPYQDHRKALITKDRGETVQ